MFDSIFASSITASQFFLMAAAALVSGAIYGWLLSFRVRASRRFFVSCALLPCVVGTVITFVSGSIGAGVAFGGALALTRFRSAQASADEMAGVLIAMGAGVAFGMGYVGYGAAILLGLGLVFLALSALPVFEHKAMAEEKLLRVTVPESMEFTDAFSDLFAQYLLSAENCGVKTTGMGSMFRLSYRIRMKAPARETAFLDELRTRNGNLEISLTPWAEPQITL